MVEVMTAYPPPLHEPLLRLLQHQLASIIQSYSHADTSIEEAYLQQRLGLKLQTDISVSADMALFQQHFILYHLLYRIQQDWHDTGAGYLHIALAKVQLLPQAAMPELNEDSERRAYYLNWQHFYTMTEQMLDQHLAAFWRYISDGAVTPTELDMVEALSVLQLPDNFSLLQLKKAYRSLALQQHPDRGGSEQQFIVLTEAYQQLLRRFS